MNQKRYRVRLMLQKRISKKVFYPVTILLLVISLLNSAHGQEEKDLFMADGNGRIYIFGSPSKKIKDLIPELSRKHPGREWKVRFKNGFAKEINLRQPLKTEEKNFKKLS